MKKVVDITGALKRGDFITVLEWINRKDRSYIGYCLEVVLIERPFIRVRICGDRILSNRIVTLDMREVKFQRLSDEFVRNVTDETAQT